MLPETPFMRNKELRVSPRGIAVLDLDGVMTGYTKYIDGVVEKGFIPDGHAVSHFIETVTQLRTCGILPLVLTNRPPGQMQLYPTMLEVQEGTWATENGGSFYDVGEHKSYVNPRFQHYASATVPLIRQQLSDSLGISEVPLDSDSPQYEPGMGCVKTVIRPPTGHDAREWVEQVQMKNILGRFAHEIKIDVGKSVDIDPIGLSKGIGMQDLLRVNNIDPNKVPIAFIADARRDIEGAQALLQLSGQAFIGAVGNSHPDFKQFVEVSGGLIAPSDTSYHSSASYLLKQFLQKFNL